MIDATTKVVNLLLCWFVSKCLWEINHQQREWLVGSRWNRYQNAVKRLFHKAHFRLGLSLRWRGPQGPQPSGPDNSPVKRTDLPIETFPYVSLQTFIVDNNLCLVIMIWAAKKMEDGNIPFCRLDWFRRLLEEFYVFLVSKSSLIVMFFSWLTFCLLFAIDHQPNCLVFYPTILYMSLPYSFPTCLSWFNLSWQGAEQRNFYPEYLASVEWEERKVGPENSLRGDEIKWRFYLLIEMQKWSPGGHNRSRISFRFVAA